MHVEAEITKGKYHDYDTFLGAEAAAFGVSSLEYEKNKFDALLHCILGLKMKGIVVYDTSYGNTKKIVETIAETLKEAGIEADLFHIKEVKKLRAKDYSFLVLGSPTKFGTMSFAMKFFLGRVKSEEWLNKLS